MRTERVPGKVRRRRLTICASGILAAVCGQPGLASAFVEVEPGLYRMEGARSGTLVLERGEGDWTILLRGGAPVDMGAATPADCELLARGPSSADGIQGVVTPFEGEIASVTEQDLQGRRHAVIVRVEGDVARVRVDYDGCGLGADLSGDYRRVADD